YQGFRQGKVTRNRCHAYRRESPEICVPERAKTRYSMRNPARRCNRRIFLVIFTVRSPSSETGGGHQVRGTGRTRQRDNPRAAHAGMSHALARGKLREESTLFVK